MLFLTILSLFTQGRGKLSLAYTRIGNFKRDFNRKNNFFYLQRAMVLDVSQQPLHQFNSISIRYVFLSIFGKIIYKGIIYFR